MSLTIPIFSPLFGKKGYIGPSSLFRANEQGVWYDPSDLTTLYQDAAGTIPVTAVEQPVGLMRDKSKNLLLGPELIVNGDFSQDSTGWTFGTRWSISGGKADAVGVATGQDLQSAGLCVSGKTYQVSYTLSNVSAGGISVFLGTSGIGRTANGTYTEILTATASTNIVFIRRFSDFTGTIDNISVKELPGNHAYQATSANRPTLSARYNVLLATETLETQSVTTQATSYKLTFTGTGSITLSGTATGTYLAGTHTITCAAGTLTLTVGGSVTKADLRPSNHGTDLPPYQRVTTDTDYDTVGFPPYLAFNGTSSSMVTNSIDFSATDKMSVWAGVRKLSDAAIRTLFVFGATGGVAGCFEWLFPPNTSSIKLECAYAGTGANYSQVYTAVAPVENVINAAIVSSLAANAGGAKIRRNGALLTPTTATPVPTSGNFGNFALTIGSRPTFLWFFGNIYSLIIRGAQSTDKQVSNAESWINKKIGKVY